RSRAKYSGTMHQINCENSNGVPINSTTAAQSSLLMLSAHHPTPGPQQLGDAFQIEHATTPGAAAGQLQRRPKFRIGGQSRIGRQMRRRTAPRQNLRALLGRETAVAFAYQIHGSFETV